MVVVITCGLCKNKWNQITPEYKNEKSQSNEKFLKESKDKYPVIEGQEVIYLEYLSKEFDYSKYIKAKDYTGKDISNKIIAIKMTEPIRFTKMHGAGNDYIYVNTMAFPVRNPEELAIRLSAPHTGIGSDGLVLIGSSKIADFSMRIFNADGSEAMMCGNASRCI